MTAAVTPFEPFPTLETERLVLRQLRPAEDAPAFFEIFSDPEAMRWWSHLPHREVAESQALIARSLTASLEGKGIEWAVTLRGDDRPIGKLAIHHWVKEHFRAQVGYLMAPRVWRRGYTTEALRAVVHFAFARLELHSVEAQLDPDNVASSRTVESLGFVREGHLRENYYLDGKFSDTLIYSLVAR